MGVWTGRTEDQGVRHLVHKLRLGNAYPRSSASPRHPQLTLLPHRNACTTIPQIALDRRDIPCRPYQHQYPSPQLLTSHSQDFGIFRTPPRTRRPRRSTEYHTNTFSYEVVEQLSLPLMHLLLPQIVNRVSKLRLGHAYPRSSASPSHARLPPSMSGLNPVGKCEGRFASGSVMARGRSGASGRCGPQPELGTEDGRDSNAKAHRLQPVGFL